MMRRAAIGEAAAHLQYLVGLGRLAEFAAKNAPALYVIPQR
jgi:hypothetical protein